MKVSDFIRERKRKRRMFTINLELLYTLSASLRATMGIETDSEISLFLIVTGINAIDAPHAEGGVQRGVKNRTEVRVAGTVVDKVTGAREAKAKTLVLAEVELKHVKGILEQWCATTGIPHAYASSYEKFLTEIEATLSRGPDKTVA